MSDIRSRLADALRGRCSHDCMFLPERAADALLSLPGIAIVELPEPVPFDPAHDCVGRWRVGEYGAVVAYSDGYIIDEAGRDLGPLPIARQFAAALLAASVQAQEEQ